jgi:hypothetical protein
MFAHVPDHRLALSLDGCRWTRGVWVSSDCRGYLGHLVKWLPGAALHGNWAP